MTALSPTQFHLKKLHFEREEIRKQYEKFPGKRSYEWAISLQKNHAKRLETAGPLTLIQGGLA